MTYIGVVHFCAILQQHLQHLDVTLGGCEVKRGPANILNSIEREGRQQTRIVRESVRKRCDSSKRIKGEQILKKQFSRFPGPSTYMCAIDVDSLVDGLVHDVQQASPGSFEEVSLGYTHG